MRRNQISVDICSHLFGLWNYSRWRISVNNYRNFLMNFLNRTRHHFRQLRNHGTDYDFINMIHIDLIGLIKHQNLNKQFIRRLVRFCINDPRDITVVIIKQSKTDIGISYIDYNGIHFLIFVRSPMLEDGSFLCIDYNIFIEIF